DEREVHRSRHAPRRTGQDNHMFGIPDGAVSNGYQKHKPGRRADFMNDPKVIAKREKALAKIEAFERMLAAE
ncbi:MAG: ISNCY family transposase, partial [Mesorhizobium sp.]